VPKYNKGNKGQYQLVVNKSKWEELKRKLKYLTKKTIPASFDERIERINQLTRGWINYFKLASIRVKLEKIEQWLRNRLRYCIWHDWKKPSRKRKNLIRLGMGSVRARNSSYIKGWKMAQGPTLRTVITIERLEKRGLMNCVKYYKTLRIIIEPLYTRTVRTVV
jgi:RNA-directed DNA polymerase